MPFALCCLSGRSAPVLCPAVVSSTAALVFLRRENLEEESYSVAGGVSGGHFFSTFRPLSLFSGSLSLRASVRLVCLCPRGEHISRAPSCSLLLFRVLFLLPATDLRLTGLAASLTMS